MPPRKSVSAPETGLKMFWSGFRVMHDYWGNELKRYYRLETLASALEHAIRTRDKAVLGSVQAVLGPAPVNRLQIELFQEGRFQLIFRVRAENVRRNTAQFAMVVAKNHAECTQVARAEFRNLTAIYPSAPEWVVKPYLAGTVFLPDRHGRSDQGREVFFYLTQWLKDYDELGVNDNLQFFCNVPKRHTFTKAETDMLKGQMVQIITSVYDAKQARTMAMPEIASGDFVVHRSARGRHLLKLIACRRLVMRTSPKKLIHKILTSSWPWGRRHFYLAPDHPETFFKGLSEGVGMETAREWLDGFVKDAAAGKYSGVPEDYLEGLREFVVK